MTNRILLACGIVICGIGCFVIADDWVAIGTDAGDSSVARESANRIEKALRQRAECNFVDRPLEEVCTVLESVYHTPIWIDKQALQDEGINMETQITLVKSGIPLESILRLILEPLGLTYVNREGVLTITTKVKANEKQTTRIYPVADLVNVGTQPGDYVLLMQILQRSPDTKWADVDGEGGSMTPFPIARSLVISQTQKVHREIAGILAALRRARHNQHLASIPADSDDPDELNSEETESARSRTRSREGRPSSNWQHPRIHAAE